MNCKCNKTPAKENTNILYFDNAATTKPDPRVVKNVNNYLTTFYGNPSSNHSLGRSSFEAVENARLQCAITLNCIPDEILFTSGATESNNLAIKSCANFCKKCGEKGFHFILSSIEHKSVSKLEKYLQQLGHEVDLINVKKDGRIDLDHVQDLIKDNTALISCIMINNETGIIQPIEELAEITDTNGILLHIDATQAFGKYPVIAKDLGTGMISFSGHKFYGPKGIGGLYIGEDVEVECMIEGGSQENGKRAGTENVPGIVGMGKAAEILLEEREEDYSKYVYLDEYFDTSLRESGIDFEVNGDIKHKVPWINNINFGIDGDELIEKLGGEVCISKSSACSKDFIPSHVLKAMGKSDDEIKNSVRISFSKYTTTDEIDELVDRITRVLK